MILRIVFVSNRARAASTRLHVMSTEGFAKCKPVGLDEGARLSALAEVTKPFHLKKLLPFNFCVDQGSSRHFRFPKTEI